MKTMKRTQMFLFLVLGLIGFIPLNVSANGWMNQKKPYQYTGVTEYLPNQDQFFNIGGARYDEGYVFYLWNAAGTSQVLYNLKEGYSNFSFKVGHIDNTSSYTAKLKIYLDGRLSQTVELKPADIAKNVSVDLSGVKHMKIQMTSQEALNHYDIYYGIYDGIFVESGNEIKTPTASNLVGNKEPYQQEGSHTEVVKSIQMAGDTFADCLQMYLWNPAGNSKLYFNFNGAYKSISFLVGHIDNTARVDAKLEITVDGEIVDTVPLTADGLPVSVTVPLENTYQMVFSLLSDAPLNSYDIYYGIGGIQLESNGKVTGVTLSQTSVTLTDSNPSMVLSSTVIPEDADNPNVIWSSNNDSIVSVDQNGVIKAVSQGNAVITAQTEDGGYEATCAVASELSQANSGDIPPADTGSDSRSGQTADTTQSHSQASVMEEKDGFWKVKYSDGIHTYRVFDIAMTWDDAKKYCEALEGHLVTIANQEENDLIQKMSLQNGGRNLYWLGLYKEMNTSWRWVTGEYAEYYNWAKGEPGGSGESVAELYRNYHNGAKIGEWNDDIPNPAASDFYDIQKHGFVCEWEPGKDPLTLYKTNLYSESDLLWMTVNLAGTYTLMRDIPLSSEFIPIGTADAPFTGTFNGNGFKITGLNINSPTANTGLFGYTNGAVVKGVTISGNVQGTDHVGGLIGFAYSTTICNCTANITASGTNKVGCLIGCVDKSIVYNCQSDGTASSKRCAGGICGDNYSDSTIENCTNFAAVTGDTLAGGITGGSTGGLIQNCNSQGRVTGTSRLGGIAGDNAGYAGKRYNNYFLKTQSINSGYAPIGNGSACYAKVSGKLTAAVTINNKQYTTPVSALNAWVDVNKTSKKQYLAWRVNGTRLVLTSEKIQIKDNPTKFNIKNQKTYKKSKKVTVKDADGIKAIKLNNKKIKVKSGAKSASFKLSKYRKYLKKKKKWNKLTVTDVKGKKKTVKFKVK